MFPVIYYDANTDRRIEQNRANAIRHVIETSINNRSVGFVCIRYSGGYYYFYIMFKASNDNCITEIISYDAKINLWSFQNEGDEYIVNPV